MVNNVSTSVSYVEVDETPIEDYGQDVFKLDSGTAAHDQGEPSENDSPDAAAPSPTPLVTTLCSPPVLDLDGLCHCPCYPPAHVLSWLLRMECLFHVPKRDASLSLCDIHCNCLY